MSRPNLTNHPAVSFTVKRPPNLSKDAPDSAGGASSFKAPSSSSAPFASSAHSTHSRSGSGNQGSSKRHSNAEPDSSDEEDGTEDEIITGFDALGVQRCVLFSPAHQTNSTQTHTQISLTAFQSVKERPVEGPLVIAPLANRDWRAAARRRQSAGTFVPEAGRAAVGTGADGSVGGLGTRDTINSGPQLSGIVSKHRPHETVGDALKDSQGTIASNEDADVEMTAGNSAPVAEDENLTEDQKALRAILAGDVEEVAQIDIIPAMPSSRGPPMTETDAYREDVMTRPDSATLDDYSRIPVEQFGAALLRGMGWKEGMAASKTRKGLVEPYVPASRPALLGIGAKERPADEGAPAAGNRKPQRPEKRYVPLVKRARDGTIIDDSREVNIPQMSSVPQKNSSHASSSPSQMAVARTTPSSSRRQSQSPPRRSDRERDSSRRRDDYDDDRSSSRRDRDRYTDSSDRDRDREKDRDYRRRDEKTRDRDRDRDRTSHYDAPSRSTSERREHDRRSDRDDRDKYRSERR